MLIVAAAAAGWEWWCLDWNTPSIAFYRGLGAQPMDEWTVYRLSGDTLRKLVGKEEMGSGGNGS